MLTSHEALHLLGEPRECLKVLAFFAAHPTVSPLSATRTLHVSLRTWYGAVQQLEALELILVDRVPGGMKIRRVEVTPHGKAVLRLLEGLPAFLSNSPAALERELALRGAPAESKAVGDTLCRLIEHAHRRGDLEALRRLRARANRAPRPGEEHLAAGLIAYLERAMPEAYVHFGEALKALEREPESRAFARSLYHGALALDQLGDSKAAYELFTRLRTLARNNSDALSEADARMGIGTLKARLGQFEDATKHLDRALACARRASSTYREANVLSSLCMISFFVDPAQGLSISDEALVAARRSGARVLLMHVHANRALMLAVMGHKKEALDELFYARRMSRVVAHEQGPEMLAEWARLVRRIVRLRRPPTPADWREQALRILQAPRIAWPQTGESAAPRTGTPQS